MPLVTITKFTVRGYVKERVLLVVIIFALLLMSASYVLAPLAVGAQHKIIIDIGLAAISLFGVMLVILLGASSYSREKEKGILPSLLAKPISRVDFVLGKYFGTVVTIAAVMLIMAVVYLFVMYLSDSQFNGTILTSIYLSVLEMALLTAVMTLFSSFTSPLLSAFFTACVFVAGHLGKDLFAFAEQMGSGSFKIIAAIGYYGLPNFSLFNIRPEAVHDLPLLQNYVWNVSIYGVFYALVLLFLSSVIYRRRDVT